MSRPLSFLALVFGFLFLFDLALFAFGHAAAAKGATGNTATAGSSGDAT